MAALAGPAAAQVATSSGSRIVLDPETRQARVVNPLDAGPRYAPPVPDYQEPIVLKKPKRHKPKPPPPQVAEAPPPEQTPPPQTQTAEQPGSSESSGADAYVSDLGGPAAAPEPAPAPKPAPKKVAEKPKPAPAPEPAQSPETMPFSFGGHDNYGLPPSKPQQQANAEPAPAQTAKGKSGIGQVRNIHINFPPGAAEPSADVAAALQSLAGDLTNELQAKSGRLLLQAFAGSPGDKSSEARRLSLKRALAVRQLLIDSGVPSDKIDVRAMGGTTDAGKPDRVDVMLHT